MHASIEQYFQRFGFCAQQIETAPPLGLEMVVVIPCYDEPALLNALEALWRCEPPRCAVEVIVVINSSQDASAAVGARNTETEKTVLEWIAGHDRATLRFHVLHFADLPQKKAGVGLARKIGMDEALRRFGAVGRLHAPIVCFDADCTCDASYLVELERFFATHPKAPGCSIYFEHPLGGPEDPRVYEAVTLYELHLRYYVEALRYAGFPHAFHTIGSSMAVRAQSYLEQGGMNKRQAGEDFYFLHKIIPLRGFAEVNSTRVIASPRASERVPFGTGRAVGEYLASGKFASYPLQAFEDLRFFFADLADLYRSDAALESCSNILREFLRQEDVGTNLRVLRENTASQGAFQKRFFGWFDGFLAMKFIHFARDKGYGSAEVTTVARELYEKRTRALFGPFDARELLLAFRNLQRVTASAWSARS